MALFDLHDLEVSGRAESDRRKASAAKEIRVRGVELAAARSLSRVGDVIGAIEPGMHRHIVSEGEWALHDTLAHVLDQTGPADVWLATWSISPDGLGCMLRQQEGGLLRSFSVLMDWRLKVRRPDAVQLARGAGVRLRVGNCHAKAAVVRNERWNLVIITSANLTNNPRIECYVLLDDFVAADFHTAWIERGMVEGAEFADQVQLF